MTDRELLELAAKAAGYLIVLGKNDSDSQVLKQSEFYIRNDRGIRHEWNPLTDDGDALRLAIKTRKFPEVFRNGLGVSNGYEEKGRSMVPIIEIFGDDPCAATRRCIVRAAAEIGKSMP